MTQGLRLIVLRRDGLFEFTKDGLRKINSEAHLVRDAKNGDVVGIEEIHERTLEQVRTLDPLPKRA